MVVTMKKVKMTLEYQETMNVDIGNIASTKKTFGISIYEVIDDSQFEAVIYFLTIFLTNVKNSK